MDPIYQQCFARDGWKCRHCNNRNGLHPHHVVYQSRGDASEDALHNLITLCWICHRGHHDGNLQIKVIEVQDKNVLVKFTRKQGWKP
jgi:5-methylcytosine-specific restriction endonuclease McrA